METLKEIIFSEDPFRMNWLREDYPYAEVVCRKRVQKQLEFTENHTKSGDEIRTEIHIRNSSDRTILISSQMLGIRIPLQDRYESSKVCISSRCHVHLFMGKNISYIYALRMGGNPPHFGMVVTKGSFDGYSVERDIRKMSNDRGCFLLHPSPMEIGPGEEKILAWVIFPHSGEADFFRKAGEYRRFLRVEADRYVLFPKEDAVLRITASFPAESITVNGKAAEKVTENVETTEKITVKGQAAEKTGEFLYCCRIPAPDPWKTGDAVFSVCADGIVTSCCLYRHADFSVLERNRCLFIARKQQYHGEDQHLNGAYLIYDNEEEHLFYASENDYNAARERVGMALCEILYLQSERSRKLSASDRMTLENSLRDYLSFALREVIRTDTGDVCNDYLLDDSYERLYNAPWYAELLTEAYGLWPEEKYLEIACRIIRRFYEKGGEKHYSIELPILALCRALKKAGKAELLCEMTDLFRKHGNSLISIDVYYPPSEVNFEQSIVAPAADILLQLYLLTGEEKYRKAGKKQLSVLELFNGHQPDYHRYETAIRHWDGYWFGKYSMYGDTFPHYWSGLTGRCFLLWYQISRDEIYRKRAEDSLRGVLPLIFEDGRASCAYVFPQFVNGEKAGRFDVFANDQDWALFFWQRMKRDACLDRLSL